MDITDKQIYFVISRRLSVAEKFSFNEVLQQVEEFLQLRTGSAREAWDKVIDDMNKQQ